MAISNEQVKKKVGRPLKNGAEAQSDAARSKEYRRRRQGLATFWHNQTQELATALTRVIVQTSDRGVLDHHVMLVLDSNPGVIKYIKDELKGPGHEVLLFKAELVKSLDNVVKSAAQTDLEDFITKGR